MDLQGRLIRALSIAVAVMLAFGLGTVIVRSGRSSAPTVLGVRQTRSPSPEPSFEFPTPASSVPAESPESSPSPASTSSPSPSKPACHNSYDPACGPFSWTRPPGSNSPMTINLSYGPVQPTAGETVTYTIQVIDRDAAAQMVEIDFGDGPAQHVIVDCAARYGPWDPPARNGGTKTFTYKHTYRTAGTYTAHFTASSKGCDNPYGNTLDIRQPIRVDPAPAPSPSPSESATPFP